VLNFDRDDSYYCSGLGSSWFSENFDDYLSRFPFIGARERLVELQKKKTILRSMVEAISKRVKITSILSLISEHIIGVKLPTGAEPNKLAEDLIKILDEERNKQAIERFLANLQAKCRKSKRYFDSISMYLANGTSFSKATPSTLQNEIVVVSGQLVHKKSIAQYNDTMAQTVSNLPEWLLTDFPPHGMVSKNDRFDGAAIGLEIEKEFSELFGQYLPFNTEFGWYPYARVTGFFKEPGFGKSLPTVAVIMTEFKRPRAFEKQRREIFSFLGGELEHLIYLSKRSNFLLATYLLPLIVKGANIQRFVPAPDEKSIIEAYVQNAGDDLPLGLKSWYENAIR
jgi:hypothetical protein